MIDCPFCNERGEYIEIAFDGSTITRPCPRGRRCPRVLEHKMPEPDPFVAWRLHERARGGAYALALLGAALAAPAATERAVFLYDERDPRCAGPGDEQWLPDFEWKPWRRRGDS